MPILDDEQFESYLKEFCPLAPAALEIEKQPNKARRPLVVTMWAAACAASLLLTFLWWRGPKPTEPGSTPQAVSSQSLTLGRANSLLVHAPSFKQAFDELSFQPQPASQPRSKKSALAVLSKENIKL